MKCPNCNNESEGQKWCPYCGIKLEMDEIVNQEYERNYDDPDIYTEQEEPVYSNSGKALKITLGIILGIGLVLMLIVVLMKMGIFNMSDKGNDGSEPIEQTVLEQENIDNLLKKGQTYLSIGDYESAEAVYKAIIEIDVANKEAKLLYQIVYNYNRAYKKLEVKKYEEARSFCDKIPFDYTEYPIKDDVEKLEDAILAFEINAKTFEEVTEYIEDSDYESASDSIGLLDEEYLTDTELDLLSRYKKEINSSDPEEKETKKSTKPAVAGTGIGMKEAQVFIESYCKAMVSAINSGDFKVVSDYLAGNLYTQQKNYVASCYKDGITEEFDFLTVKSVSRSSENKWAVTVSEGETIHYANGTDSSKTFSWIYTIEEIDGSFYLTQVE